VSYKLSLTSGCYKHRQVNKTFLACKDTMFTVRYTEYLYRCITYIPLVLKKESRLPH